jgi:hypothetical protein
MRINLGTLATSMTLILVFGSDIALSDEPVGEVVRADAKSQIERSGPVVIDPIFDGQAETHVIQLNDTLSSSKGGFVQMHLDLERRTEVIVREGRVNITETDEGLTCNVSGTVLFSRSRVRKDASKSCDVFAGGFNFRHLSTEFLIDARGVETSLFVMEGAVEVSSADPNFPEKQEVVAGEWLATRKGHPVPRPQRYLRSDPGSGSSVCLYSWCRITRNILTDGPDIPIRVLIPPPPNPPGRQ